MPAQDMRHFVDGGFKRIDGQRINGNLSSLAVSLTIAIDHLKGLFLDVEVLKGFRSVSSLAFSIGLVFLALSLSQNEPARLPDKERVMLCCLLPGFVLDGFLARDRHTQPDGLFSALDEPALAVPVSRDLSLFSAIEKESNQYAAKNIFQRVDLLC